MNVGDGCLTTPHELVFGRRPVQSIHAHAVFGALVYRRISDQERKKSSDGTLGDMAADGFYVGRVDNPSPTYRILTQDVQDMTGAFKGERQILTHDATSTFKGERFFKGESDTFYSGGSDWQIKSVSYADVIVKDDIYGERERLEPRKDGPQDGDEIKIFQAARLASTTGRRQASKSAGKTRGKPKGWTQGCLLYTSPSPRDQRGSRMPSSA